MAGTYDGERLTLTEPPTVPEPDGDDEAGPDFSPACDEPDVVDPSEGVAEWEEMTQVEGFEIPDLVAAWVSDPDPFVGNVILLPGARQAAVDRVREHYAGPLCVVESEAPTEAELATVRDELADEEARAALGPVGIEGTDERRGVVTAIVWVADDAAIAYARDRWPNLVALHPLLHPVN